MRNLILMFTVLFTVLIAVASCKKTEMIEDTSSDKPLTVEGQTKAASWEEQGCLTKLDPTDTFQVAGIGCFAGAGNCRRARECTAVDAIAPGGGYFTSAELEVGNWDEFGTELIQNNTEFQNLLKDLGWIY